MAESGIDWFIVFCTDPHLSEYTAKCDRYLAAVSGFSGSAGTLVVGSDEAFLWTDSRYHVQAAKQLLGTGISLMKAGLSGVPTVEDYLSDHVWDGQTVSFDFYTASYDKYKAIRDVLNDTITVTDGSSILKKAIPDLPARNFNTVDTIPLKYSGKSTGEKLGEIRKTLRNKYARNRSYTYILSDLTAVMWLFDLRGRDVDFVPVAYAYAMITDVSATLYVCRKMLTSNAVAGLSEASVSVREYSCFYKDACDIATDIVLADSCTNNASLLIRFDDDGIYTDCPDAGIIKKSIKNSTEIEGMKKAHLTDAVTMIRFIRRIKQMAEDGVLSDEFATGKMLDEMRLSQGASALSFKTICAYADNAAVVHYTARQDSARQLLSEGYVLVDSGGQYENLGTTDITRTISLGSVSDEEKRVYTTVLKGHLRLMGARFPQGFKGAFLDGIAEQPLWDAGYFCGHGIGHGVGHFLSVHEPETRISRGSSMRESEFFPGVIVSDEPGIYIEGRFGVRIENLLLTVDGGTVDGNKMCTFEPLTLVPYDKESIDFSMLTEHETRILKDYYDLVWEKVSPLLDDDEKAWLKENIDIK